MEIWPGRDIQKQGIRTSACDERFPLVDLEFGGKAWSREAHGGRNDTADRAGCFAARTACFSRELPQNLGRRMGCSPGLALG